MNSISQLMKYCRAMVEYALKHGVAKTAIKYNTYRPYIAGFDVMTAHWIINPAGQNTIPKHIQLRN